MDTAKYQSKQHSDNRILVVRPIEGKQVLSTTGIVDSRLFKGGNTLHAIRDSMTSLWRLKYGDGILPNPLKQTFTGFSSLMNFTNDYLHRRGLEIVEVVDHYDEN